MKNMGNTVMCRIFPNAVPDRCQRVIEALPVKLNPGKSQVIAMTERRKRQGASSKSGEKFVIV